jgi:[acyl-carrier-protein] S-malonyltransferase
MLNDGATEFIECGPGKVLQGLVSKIHKDSIVSGVN